MPHPSIVFYLDADSAVVFGRKQELQLDEIARQQIAYRALAETHDRFVSLDANRSSYAASLKKWGSLLVWLNKEMNCRRFGVSTAPTLPDRAVKTMRDTQNQMRTSSAGRD